MTIQTSETAVHEADICIVGSGITAATPGEW